MGSGGGTGGTASGAEATQAGAAGAGITGFDRGAAVTRSLLGYGVIVGPFYLAVGLAQALMREGFDLKRHALSVLANGEFGWVQTLNFVLSGLMVIAAAIGARRVLGAGSRGLTWCLGAFGLSMLVAAFFRADPADGFPPGTPAGFPATISTAGMVHLFAGVVGFTMLGVSGLFGARTMSHRKERRLARLSLASGLAVIVLFYGGAALAGGGPIGILGIWLSVIVGWAWIAIISLKLYRMAPDPNC